MPDMQQLPMFKLYQFFPSLNKSRSLFFYSQPAEFSIVSNAIFIRLIAMIVIKNSFFIMAPVLNENL